MQMLYNSDSFAVLWFDGAAPGSGLGRGGFEIVDKQARKEIYLEGLMAESFQTGVQAMVAEQATPEALDAFMARYTALAQQPLVVH